MYEWGSEQVRVTQLSLNIFVFSHDFLRHQVSGAVFGRSHHLLILPAAGLNR